MEKGRTVGLYHIIYSPSTLEKCQLEYAPGPLEEVAAGRRSSQREPADPCTAPSAGGTHPEQTQACPRKKEQRY